MIQRLTFVAGVALVALGLAMPAYGAEAPCDLTPRARCFGLESLDASLSTTQAGAHPDLTFGFEVKKDPESDPNPFGLRNAYSPTRNVRIELPPGLIGDPNALGTSQQCTAQELSFLECPNGSQVGITNVYAYNLNTVLREPVYMMQPPGGEVVARLGFIAGLPAIYVDLTVRSESNDDFGITAEIHDVTAEQRLIKAETTTWGVPADPSHDIERCTPTEVVASGCKVSPPRPPGSRPLPFMTNPTRCGVPLQLRVGAASWAEPTRFDTKSAAFPDVTGCDNLPFGPGVNAKPTNGHAASPSGLDMTIRLPKSDGVDVLEPSQIRDIRIDLPPGLVFNPAVGDGLEACSADQVRLGKRENAQCPDAAKVASAEFEVGGLPRRMKGAIYLREPEPGNPFRIWVVADDLGAHVKIFGQLIVDRRSGQIHSVVLDNPQVPLREVKLHFFAGTRAPLVNPNACGTYQTHYEFTPWSGNPPVAGDTAMKIDEGCNTGGFSPRIAGGTTNLAAGKHSPFVFTLTREDGEQNPASLDISLPPGLAATFAGIPHCEGAAAVTGACPPASRIGRVITAVGAGSDPLWVPQPGKRPTAVYLGGPYKGGPFSIVAVVPAQAGPFDFGDEVVRSALYVNPLTAQGIVRSDPLPQSIEGIPIRYRTIQVELDRPDFTLNPTSCAEKTIAATVASSQGAVVSPSARFGAVECSRLAFKPRLSLRLKGGTKRGDHPGLTAVTRPRAGDANLASVVARLPHSAFLDQAHIRTICTRIQYAAGAGQGEQCPAGAVYGRVKAISPLLDKPLTGPVYLRSSSHNLPDLVLSLHGEVDVEAVGRIDSVKGGIRASFEAIPDAPLSEVVLEMQGGKKGLIVNSTNICRGKHRAAVSIDGHNGKRSTLKPPLQARCGKRR